MPKGKCQRGSVDGPTSSFSALSTWNGGPLRPFNRVCPAIFVKSLTSLVVAVRRLPAERLASPLMLTCAAAGFTHVAGDPVTGVAYNPPYRRNISVRPPPSMTSCGQTCRCRAVSRLLLPWLSEAAWPPQARFCSRANPLGSQNTRGPIAIVVPLSAHEHNVRVTSLGPCPPSSFALSRVIYNEYAVLMHVWILR